MPIEIQTYDGVPAGMNLAKPSFELADNEARYLQDILLDYPGLARRRGPVKAATGFPTLPNPGSGLFGTLDPAGNYRVAAIDGDNSNGYLRLLSSDYSAYETYTWNGAMPFTPPTYPYRIVDAKPALTGGVWIGTSNEYNAAAPVQNLAQWRGGINDDYATGTVTIGKASTAVTGSGTSWLTNVSPGMFLFATFDDTTSGTGKYALTYIGVVKSVESDTALTLGAVNPFVQSAATLAGLTYNLTSVRGFVPRVMVGRLTSTTSDPTVTGANTKFLSQGLGETVLSSAASTHTSTTLDGISSTSTLKVGMRVSGTGIPLGAYISSIDSGTAITLSAAATGTASITATFKHAWNIFRSSDLAWVGRLDTVTNETSLELAANAAVAMNNDRFIAFKMTGDYSITNQDTDQVGFLSATYANRNWYANNGQRSEYTSRVWFSDTADPEGVDESAYDGDFLNINSSVGTDTPIKALVPAYNALVVIKENEAFAIYGSTPTTFSVKKIEDDGALCGMTAVAYGGGVIWAGKDGIHYYDGITVDNISANKLGNYYKNAVRNVDPTKYRMWGCMIRDHYFLFLEQYAPSVAVIKGQYSVTPSSATIVVNMVSSAFSIFTNLPFRACLETPADTGKKSLYLYNDVDTGYICQGYDLFDTDGENDSILGSSGVAAASFRYGYTSNSDDTLGAATALAVSADTKYLSTITTYAPAAVQSVHVYMGGIGGGSSTGGAKAIIYDSGGNLLGTSAEVTVAQDDQPGFVGFTFASAVLIDSGDYDVGVICEAAVSNVYHWATADAIQYAGDTYAGGATDPIGATSLTTGPLVQHMTVKSAGPDFFLESKKYTMGDALRKKLFKQLALNYLAQAGSIKLDTVLGLNNVGRTATSSYPASTYTWSTLGSAFATWDSLSATYATWDDVTDSVYRPKRIKFLKRSQMMSFRLWQESPIVTRAEIGPFQFGFKWQRPGRI